jgi:hypothetical protein
MLASHVGVTGEAFYQHQTKHQDVGQTSGTSRSYSYGVRFGLSVFVR